MKALSAEAYNQPSTCPTMNALRFLVTTSWRNQVAVHKRREKPIESISPDNWGHRVLLTNRYWTVSNEATRISSVKNIESIRIIVLQLCRWYGANPPLYPAWQKYLRKHQPPTLIVWGKNDEIFPATGAEPYKRDLDDLEYHLIDTGHFALESHGEEIAELMRDFLNRKVDQNPLAAN